MPMAVVDDEHAEEGARRARWIEVVAAEHRARVESRIGYWRQQGHVPLHGVADAEAEPIGMPLTPELEEEAAHA